VGQESKLGWAWVQPISLFQIQTNLILEIKIMAEWSLSTLLASLHQDVERQLKIVRETLAHPGTKGDASEEVWLELFDKYLPARYQAKKAHVIDSLGTASQQIDVVIFDRQYSPFIFNFKDGLIIPAESVYAVFEVKQTMNADHVHYAQDKIASVRRLHRTSLPIPSASGILPPKPPTPIIGGLVTFESEWEVAFGKPFEKAMINDDPNYLLDIGCVAAHGYFCSNKETGALEIINSNKATTAFLFKLISQLQFSGTVPMIDIQAYSNWLTK
jgi:hypothetical protein